MEVISSDVMDDNKLKLETMLKYIWPHDLLGIEKIIWEYNTFKKS